MATPTEQSLLQRAWSVFRQIAGYASIVVGAIPATGLSAAERAPLIAFGGLIHVIEHYVADPSTGNPSTPPS